MTPAADTLLTDIDHQIAATVLQETGAEVEVAHSRRHPGRLTVVTETADALDRALGWLLGSGALRMVDRPDRPAGLAVVAILEHV